MTKVRTPPSELEFPYPPCSLCGKETYHDGDCFRCDDCEASWNGSGQRGAYDEPNLPACLAYIEWFNTDALSPEYESIRHAVWQCDLADGHEDEHRRLDGFSSSKWSDDDPRVVPEPTEET